MINLNKIRQDKITSANLSYFSMGYMTSFSKHSLFINLGTEAKIINFFRKFYGSD